MATNPENDLGRRYPQIRQRENGSSSCPLAARAWLFGVLVVVPLLCAALPGAVAAQTLAGKTWAIVIGVSRYGDSSLSERSLRYAESDAQEIRDALIERCRVPQQNIHLLKGPKATKAGIEKAFASVAKSARSGDLVFIYFSGHGSFIPDRDGDEVDGDRLDEVLLPYDAVLGDESTYIIDDALGYMVSRLPASLVAIVMDTCHSAGQGKSVPAPGLLVKGTGDSIAKDVFTDAGGGSGRALLSACQSGEVAYENEALGHGVLTYFVLQAIEQQFAADSDHNGVLTFDELGAFVDERVDAWCLENGVFQTPSYESKSSTPIIIVPIVVIVPRSPLPSPPLQGGGRAGSLGLGITQSVVLWQTPPPMVSGVTQIHVGLSLDRTEFGAFVSLPNSDGLAPGGAVGFELGFVGRELGAATLYGIVSATLDLAHDWAALSGGVRIAGDLMPYLRVGATLGLELGLSNEATGWTNAGASLFLRFSAEARLPFGTGQ
jgi:hypothetical protein